MESFNLGQLAKEMVVTRLTEIQDPCAAAADVLKRTLLTALRGRRELGPEQKKTVVEVCRGAFTGLLLAEQNLSRGAVLYLQKVSEIATDLNLDPTELMRLALQGLGDIQRFVGREQAGEIGLLIETSYMGAGRIFLQACRDRTPNAAQPREDA